MATIKELGMRNVTTFLEAVFYYSLCMCPKWIGFYQSMQDVALLGFLQCLKSNLVSKSLKSLLFCLCTKNSFLWWKHICFQCSASFQNLIFALEIWSITIFELGVKTSMTTCNRRGERDKVVINAFFVWGKEQKWCKATVEPAKTGKDLR